MKIRVGLSTVRGLAFHGAGTDNGSVGDGLQLTGGGTNTVTACYFGLAVNGVSTVPNISTGLRILDSPANTIGGLAEADKNHFADDLLISGSGASNNIVVGNLFGLLVDGVTRSRSSRLRIVDAAGNRVGGLTAGERNILSSGVVLSGTAAGNLIQGNYIGTTAVGQAVAVADAAEDGVTIEASGNQIIGNVISGNSRRGIYFGGAFNPSANLIQGNLIGTDPTGTLPVPNGTGIELYGDNNLIGGTLVSERNVISGNASHGLWLQGGGTNRVLGNYFGTAASGQARLTGAQATTNGLYFTAFGNGNVIGGLAPGERNLFSGDNVAGARFDDHARNAVFVGNWLGLAADGTTLLGNTARGLHVTETEGGNYFASNTVAGHPIEGILVGRVQGTGTATNLFFANTVRNNPGIGINLFSPTRNVVRQNSLFGNGGLAIDVFGNGPSFLPNGAEYNYPILTNVQLIGNTLSIAGSLRAPLGSYVVEFYANEPADNPPQARTYLGEITVTISQIAPADRSLVAQARLVPADSLMGVIHFLAQLLDIRTAVGKIMTARILGTEISPGQPAVGGSAEPPTAAANQNSGYTGDPINTFTGELFDTMPPDLDLAGPLPLRFQRYFASGLKRTGVSGPLGDNWRHNFEWSLATTASNTVRILNPQGRLIEFTNTGSAFVLLGRQDIPWQLASSGGNFTLGDPGSQKLHTFDNVGRLVQVASPRGVAHQLTYTAGLLTSVTDGQGRLLTFSYSAGGGR